MFRSFIYLDEEKLYAYKRQIEGKNRARPKSMTQKKTSGVSAGGYGISLNGSTETSISSEFEQDVNFDYDQFELSLKEYEANDFFDFVMSDDYDIKTIPDMKLFRLSSSFEIPEAFDVVNLIDRFMPMLAEEIETKSAGEQAALEKFLGQRSADIPIVCEYDDVVISGKLNSNNLCEEYASLVDYADQKVYLLCKVIGLSRAETVKIFDPLKDFIRLPRTVRRQMEREGNDIGLSTITVDGPVLKVEIIAIYK